MASRTPRRRASVVCCAADRLLVVRLKDPTTTIEGLFPPGGAVEAGETPAEAAAREALEETGVRVQVDGASERVETYPYVWDGVEYDVTTHYFFAAPADPSAAIVAALPKVEDATYNLGAYWKPVAEALDAMPARIRASVEAVLRDHHVGLRT